MKIDKSENILSCCLRLKEAVKLLKRNSERNLASDYHFSKFEMKLDFIETLVMVNGYDVEPLEQCLKPVHNSSDILFLKKQSSYLTKELIYYLENNSKKDVDVQKCINTFHEFIEIIPSIKKSKMSLTQRIKVLFLGN